MGYVITFFGADHKCGTSMIAQSVAEYLADTNKDKNIILIHTQQGNGDEYSPKVCESLENIRPYLSTHLIDVKSIVEKCRYNDNLFIMGGASKPASANLFSIDMTEYLFESLAVDFDYVICDAGSELDYALAIGALHRADLVYIVSSQSEHAIRRYEWAFSFFYQLGIVPYALIVNKYSKDEVNDISFIKERVGIERVICVRESKHGKRAEYDSKTLLAIKDSKFTKDIALLAKSITEGFKNE